MNITYLHHDCFLIEYRHFAVLTDYLPEAGRVPVPEGKRLYVIVSHHHKDHFSPEIFAPELRRHDTLYIISPDTARQARRHITDGSLYKGELRVGTDRVVVLKPGEGYSDNLIKVRAFGSTDCGCSYAVEADGERLFFAGDLNAWVWQDEETADESRQMVDAYRMILQTVAERYKHFDAALLPVDPRLGSALGVGPDMFLGMIKTDTLMPMHYCLVAENERGAVWEYCRRAVSVGLCANSQDRDRG